MVHEVLCTITSTPGSYGKDLDRVERAMPMILDRVFGHPGLPRRAAALKEQIYARVYLQLGYCHVGNCLAEDEPEMDVARNDLSKALAFKPGMRAGARMPGSRPVSAIALAGGADPEASLLRARTAFPGKRPRGWVPN